mmetsp:Transcript_48691/g.80773  ORF Transcript_48691/g.80773 Transcript_48691/m.80773 type:complete len:468 (+) Transcript_48691:667-2070(+)
MTHRTHLNRTLIHHQQHMCVRAVKLYIVNRTVHHTFVVRVIDKIITASFIAHYAPHFHLIASRLHRQIAVLVKREPTMRIVNLLLALHGHNHHFATQIDDAKPSPAFHAQQASVRVHATVIHIAVLVVKAHFSTHAQQLCKLELTQIFHRIAAGAGTVVGATTQLRLWHHSQVRFFAQNVPDLMYAFLFLQIVDEQQLHFANHLDILVLGIHRLVHHIHFNVAISVLVIIGVDETVLDARQLHQILVLVHVMHECLVAHQKLMHRVERHAAAHQVAQRRRFRKCLLLVLAPLHLRLTSLQRLDRRLFKVAKRTHHHLHVLLKLAIYFRRRRNERVERQMLINEGSKVVGLELIGAVVSRFALQHRTNAFIVQQTNSLVILTSNQRLILDGLHLLPLLVAREIVVDVVHAFDNIRCYGFGNAQQILEQISVIALGTVEKPDTRAKHGLLKPRKLVLVDRRRQYFATSS